MGQRRLTFVTDIVTPYMVAVLEAIARECALTALFCSRSGTRGLAWSLDGALPFGHELIEGFALRRRTPDATDYYPSPRLLAALRRARPEAIISGGYSFPSLYAAAYGRAARVPLLIHSDGTSRSEAALRPEQRLSRRLLARLAWGAIGNSEPASRRLREIGFARVFSAPHATRMEPFWRVAERRTPGAAALRLLAVGRLIPRKGVDLLLRAVALARTDGAPVELTVVGSGPAEPELRSLARELGLPVSWYGFVDQPGLPTVYANADAFAFPTLDDPFGMVVLEAAAAGLPLIASPHGGATEDLVRDGENGFVVDPRDTRSFARAIACLARNGDLRARMGKAAHQATQARTPTASAEGYLEAAEAAIAACPA
jgi:glycosyltransferase involved in cell wall biosynthesis